MSSGNFFAELKRRNVYKVAVASAVTAWLLIQAAAILFPTFDVPPLGMKLLVFILAAGFVVALDGSARLSAAALTTIENRLSAGEQVDRRPAAPQRKWRSKGRIFFRTASLKN